jgi:hypothetical protein
MTVAHRWSLPLARDIPLLLSFLFFPLTVHANYSPERARDKTESRRLVTTGSRGCPVALGSLSILNPAEQGKLSIKNNDKLAIEIDTRNEIEKARVQIVDPGDGTVFLDRSFAVSRPTILEIPLPFLRTDKKYILNAGILCPGSIAASNLLSVQLSVSGEL